MVKIQGPKWYLIILNGIEIGIKSMLECVFEKVDKQKVKVTVYSPNSTKIQRDS